MSEAALVFDDVRVGFAGVEVLRGVSLELQRGEILALAGPNGAGKTTLFRVASRIVRPEAGRVLVGDRPLASFSRRALAREIAVVPQDAHIAFPFRVAEIVLMGRSPHLGPLGFESAADVELARQALRRMGIEALADRRVDGLSGGERQLVLLARALAQDARVLLLDEPTAHLDLRHRVSVLELVREFVNAGGSALVVSHDLNLAARSCDRFALLKEGVIVAEGPPSEVLTPFNIERVFDIDAEVRTGGDGAPLVIPRLAQRGDPGVHRG